MPDIPTGPINLGGQNPFGFADLIQERLAQKRDPVPADAGAPTPPELSFPELAKPEGPSPGDVRAAKFQHVAEGLMAFAAMFQGKDVTLPGKAMAALRAQEQASEEERLRLQNIERTQQSALDNQRRVLEFENERQDFLRTQKRQDDIEDSVTLSKKLTNLAKELDLESVEKDEMDTHVSRQMQLFAGDKPQSEEQVRESIENAFPQGLTPEMLEYGVQFLHGAQQGKVAQQNRESRAKAQTGLPKLNVAVKNVDEALQDVRREVKDAPETTSLLRSKRKEQSEANSEFDTQLKPLVEARNEDNILFRQALLKLEEDFPKNEFLQKLIKGTTTVDPDFGGGLLTLADIKGASEALAQSDPPGNRPIFPINLFFDPEGKNIAQALLAKSIPTKDEGPMTLREAAFNAQSRDEEIERLKFDQDASNNRFNAGPDGIDALLQDLEDRRSNPGDFMTNTQLQRITAPLQILNQLDPGQAQAFVQSFEADFSDARKRQIKQETGQDLNTTTGTLTPVEQAASNILIKMSPANQRVFKNSVVGYLQEDLQAALDPGTDTSLATSFEDYALWRSESIDDLGIAEKDFIEFMIQAFDSAGVDPDIVRKFEEEIKARGF